MPFSGNTYTGPSGSTNAAPGQIVQSATWNNINTDYATALTALMSQLTTGISERNILQANGSFEVWQRGAGSSASIAVGASTTLYGPDRWYLTTGANAASIVSAAAGLSNNSLLSVKIIKNAGQTGTTAFVFGYPLDTPDIMRLRGQTVRISLLAKSGANFSPTSGALAVSLYTGTGVPAKRQYGGGFTGETTVLSISTNLGVSSATTAITGASSVIVPLTTTQAELQFTWTPVGTAGADDSITIDDVQLECEWSDTTWTPTTYDRIPFEEMLQLCKRFYQKTFNYSVAPAAAAGMPGALSYVTVANQLANLWWQFPVELRATGSITTYNPNAAGANWQDLTVTASVTVSVDTANTNSAKAVLIYGATATATVAISHLVYIQAQVDAGI